MDNAMMVIFPYMFEGVWVFDDPAVDLVQEPFVFGIPDMIDGAVGEIPDAEKGFKLLFSKNPFPGYQRKLTWLREEHGGNWYTSNGEDEGWLCPALFKYFSQAPKEIYAKAEAKG